jgi:hypothetical protein
MKNFERYLELIQEDNQIINEGFFDKKILPAIMTLITALTSLSSKNNKDYLTPQEEEMYQKLQNRIAEVISQNEKKKEIAKKELQPKIKDLLDSKKKEDDYSNSEYHKFLDEIIKNQKIKIEGKEYLLHIPLTDRELVDVIMSGRKTYEDNTTNASKYILEKIKFF